jgi:hypothetical protein
VIDAVVLIALVVSVGANLMLAQRLDSLRRTGRAPDAPPLARYILWTGQWWATSGAHRKINDRMTTVLVWISRGALAVFVIAAAISLLRR